MHDGHDASRHGVVFFTGIRPLLGHVTIQLVGHAAAGKRGLAGQHVIPGAAERIDVAADVGCFAVAGLFRRNVIDGTDGRPGAGDPRFFGLVNQTGQPHVGQLDGPVPLNQEVGGLDVAVNDVSFVGVL